METQKKRGCFLAFEGIDGSGKSTQAALLERRLAERGIPCVFTREPTDGAIGRLLRQILTGEVQSDPRVVPLVFAADRVDHLLNAEHGILRELERGVSVVTDRYYFSSYAYQSVDVPMEQIIALNAQCAELLRPTATVFIDLDPETALERIARGRDHTELFETRERLTATRAKYFEAFDRLKGTETVLIFDGAREPCALSDAIWEQIEKYFM